VAAGLVPVSQGMRSMGPAETVVQAGRGTYAPFMSHGVHARPNPRGGGLTALLAVLIGGAGFAYALSPGGERSVRLGVLGLAALMVLQLLVISGQQRTLTRSLARTQERLRVLELRHRSEGEELHQRVLEGIEREGTLLDAVTGLSDEIARLRFLLESAALGAPLVAAASPVPVPVAAPVPASVAASVLPEEVQVEVEEPGAVAVDEPGPAPAETPENGQPSRPYPPTVPVTTWVVRDIQVEGEPVAVSMRILDLTDPGPGPEPAEWPTPAAAWGQYARPA